MATEEVELAGHIIDSLLLPKVLDLVVEAGVDYRIEAVEVGRTNLDPSRVVLHLTHDDEATIDALCERIAVHGASRVGNDDAEVVVADLDGVLPAGFHSTTNLATEVRIDGHWVPVANPEMDCGLVVTLERDDGRPVVRTVPMHRVQAGDRIVVGHDGVRVHAPERDRHLRSFEFMNSEVSSEKPKALLVAHGYAFPRTHNLAALHDLCMQAELPVRMEANQLERLNAYAVQVLILVITPR